MTNSTIGADEALLTAKEAAVRLRCSERTVYRMMELREIRYISIRTSRRIPESAIDEYHRRQQSSAVVRPPERRKRAS